MLCECSLTNNHQVSKNVEGFSRKYCHTLYALDDRMSCLTLFFILFCHIFSFFSFLFNLKPSQYINSLVLLHCSTILPFFMMNIFPDAFDILHCQHCRIWCEFITSIRMKTKTKKMVNNCIDVLSFPSFVDSKQMLQSIYRWLNKYSTLCSLSCIFHSILLFIFCFFWTNLIIIYSIDSLQFLFLLV